LKREIEIKIVGRQFRDGSWEEVVTECKGKYYKEEGIIYLFYEESDDAAGVCKTRITLRERGMQVNRQGGITTTLVYDLGVRNFTTYHSPLGVFDVGNEATHYIVAEKEAGLTVDMGYKLFMGGDEGRDATLRIDARFL
jgi:uncharacterized beta-barrel protein YwiB (DUF1934 family)